METVVWGMNLFIDSKRPLSTVNGLLSEILIEYLYRTQVILMFRVDNY